MKSGHLVDRDLLPLLETFPTIAITPENLAARRERRLPNMGIPDQRAKLDIVQVPGPPGAPCVPLHIYRPIAPRGLLPTIYHMHGGGFVSGSPAQLDVIHHALVAELECALVSVDYRLAPETIFPGAIEDCHAGLAWVVANADAYGIDSKRIGVMGESAGGGLAASLALFVRDRGDMALTFQHLIYPMLDDRTCVDPDPHPFAGEFLWHAPNNRFAWSAMLGHAPGLEGVSPYAAALRAHDLTGLPPTFIALGALDLFLEENMEYARRLTRAGVPVELHIWPGAIHGFDLAADTYLARAATQAGRAALRRFLHDA